jgi:hypothetical protein
MRTTSHKFRNQRLAAIAVMVLSTLSAAAVAEPDEAARQAAREWMDRGRQQRKAADLAAALHSFKEADAIMHVPTTGLEVARAESSLGMLLEAAATIKQVIALPVGAHEPEIFLKARESATELKRELERRTPSLGFVLNPDAAGTPTQLTLDGNPLDADNSSERVLVNPGRHLAIAKRGGVVRKQELVVLEGNAQEVAFDFAPRADELTPLAADAAGRRTAPISTSSNGSTIALYGLSGLALAGTGAGVGLGLWSNHRKAELERSCAPNCNASSVDQLHASYMAANVSYAVGAASAVGALVVYLLRPTHKSDAASRPVLAVGGGLGADANVTLQGSF